MCIWKPLPRACKVNYCSTPYNLKLKHSKWKLLLFNFLLQTWGNEYAFVKSSKLLIESSGLLLLIPVYIHVDIVLVGCQQNFSTISTWILHHTSQVLGLHMVLQVSQSIAAFGEATVSALVRTHTQLLDLGIDQLLLVIWKGIQIIASSLWFFGLKLSISK